MITDPIQHSAMSTREPDILAAIFLVGGFFFSIITQTFFYAGNVIWADYIHHNPNRTYVQTIQTLHQSFPDAVFWTIFDMPLALIVATVMAVKGYKKLGRLPFWYLLLMLLVCALALCIQGRIEGFLWSENTWRYIVENLLPIFLAYMIACSWLNRRPIR